MGIVFSHDNEPVTQDNEPVAQDNEQFGSPDGRDVENQPPSPPDDKDQPNVFRELLDAAMKDEWWVVKAIVEKHPTIFVEKKTKRGETVLHIATVARSIRVVTELMKVMKDSDLELRDDGGSSAFITAVMLGFVDIAKAMVKTNEKLPNIPYYRGERFPISMAAGAGIKAMVSYLFGVTNFGLIGQEELFRLLSLTIINEMYDVALNIFNKDKDLACKILESGDMRCFYLLSQKSLAISNQERKLKIKFSSRFITWLLPKRYVVKKQAGQLLEEVWVECVKSSEEQLLEAVIKEYLLHAAAYAGNVEFLAVVTRTHPELIWHFDDEMRTIFHVAVLHRQEKVFSLIHQIAGLKGFLLLNYSDNDWNNILHLAGRLGYYNNDNDIPKMEVESLESSNINDNWKSKLSGSLEYRNNNNDIPKTEVESLESSSINDKQKSKLSGSLGYCNNNNDIPKTEFESLESSSINDKQKSKLSGSLGYHNNNNDIPKTEIESLESSSINDKQKSKLSGSLEYRNNNNDIPKMKVESLESSSINDKQEKIMPSSFLRVSGAALQMQREMLWFKEVEKLVPITLRKKRNKNGKTPRELFTEEHKLLLKEGERWMKDTANSCMIAATLIATMVFAAGFTVPGGNNDDNGIPILLHSNGFRVFVISDAVALFSSIVSIIMFLSILTSRYAEDDFLVSLPTKLLFGLTALFVSIVSMLLAFTTTFFLFYGVGSWEPKLIAACAGVPVAVFGCLQYKLWFDVAKSTYWSKFYFRPRKCKFL